MPRIASGAPRARSASRRLIDGGVVNDTPISQAVELGAERISILSTPAPRARPTRIPTAAPDAAIHGGPSAGGLTVRQHAAQETA